MNNLVTLKPIQHRDRECIGIYYDNSLLLNDLLYKHAGAKWSRTKRSWWIPLDRDSYQRLTTALKGKARIDNSLLREYLEKKNEAVVDDGQSKPRNELSKNKVVRVVRKTERANKATGYKNEKIDAVNAHVLPKMEEQLKLRGYSPSTIRTYLGEMAQLICILKKVSVDRLSPEHLRRYLVYCYEKLHLTENTLHSRINAMKFYYEQVLKRDKFFWDIPRPKKHIQLPKVLSKEEIAALLRAITNVKHKTMIMLGYGCGLRVSEITALRITDLDENRRLLTVKKGKGKKDRIVSLSPVMLVMLREYLGSYKPTNFLFEGQGPGSAYSVRSLESIIQSAKSKAGIKKEGSMHMLRHSFATHLLDRGTDVVFIQKLLGHNNIKTTLRYLHVTNKDIASILSPIEDIRDLLG